MLLQVETPAGVGPGDLFHIEHSGLLFEICVPDGVHEGQFIEVDLPLEEAQQDLLADTDAPPPELLEITVPPNAEGGAEILVEHGALQFYVTVPAGLVAGDLLTVEVPLATGHDLDEVPPLPSKAPADPTSAEAEDEVKPLRRRRRERKVSAGFESWASFPNGTTGKFDRLQEVEVYRTDGTWTPATVLTHYDASDTYDVQLRDGQIKYLVESDGLRHIKARARSIASAPLLPAPPPSSTSHPPSVCFAPTPTTLTPPLHHHCYSVSFSRTGGWVQQAPSGEGLGPEGVGLGARRRLLPR